MDNFTNTNIKNPIIEESKEYENNSLPVNSDINNSCNIDLGKIIYYFEDITNDKYSLNNLSCNEKKYNLSPSYIFQDPGDWNNNNFDGRLLSLNLKLKNVRPNKLVVLGVLVYENNKLYTFKVKKLSTLGLSYNKCKNIDAGKLDFLFYDDKPFSQKNLKVKFIYNYVMF